MPFRTASEIISGDYISPSMGESQDLPPRPPTWGSLFKSSFQLYHMTASIPSAIRNVAGLGRPGAEPLKMAGGLTLPMNPLIMRIISRENQKRNDFNPADYIPEGYEEFTDVFLNAQDEQDIEYFKSQLDSRNKARDILSRGGAASWVTSLAVGIADPAYYLLPLTRMVQAVKAAKIAGSLSPLVLNTAAGVVEGGAGGAAIASVLKTAQPEVPIEEALLTIGISALAGGLIRGPGGMAWDKLSAVNRNRKMVNLKQQVDAALARRAISRSVHLEAGADVSPNNDLVLDVLGYPIHEIKQKPLSKPGDPSGKTTYTVPGVEPITETRFVKNEPNEYVSKRIKNLERGLKLKNISMDRGSRVRPVDLIEIEKPDPINLNQGKHQVGPSKVEPSAENTPKLIPQKGLFEGVEGKKINAPDETKFVRTTDGRVFFGKDKNTPHSWIADKMLAAGIDENAIDWENTGFIYRGKLHYYDINIPPKAGMVGENDTSLNSLGRKNLYDMTKEELDRFPYDYPSEYTPMKGTHLEHNPLIQELYEPLPEDIKLMSKTDIQAEITALQRSLYGEETRVLQEGRPARKVTTEPLANSPIVNDWDDIGYEGHSLRDLSMMTDDGMKPMVPVDDRGNEIAPALGLPTLLRRIGGSRLIPGLWFGKQMENKEIQDKFFKVMSAGFLQKKNVVGVEPVGLEKLNPLHWWGKVKDVKSAPVHSSVYDKVLINTERTMGKLKTNFNKLYLKYIRELAGTDTEGSQGFSRVRASLASKSQSFSKENRGLKIHEFMKAVTRARRLRYFGIEEDGVPAAVREFDKMLGKDIYGPQAKWALESKYMPNKFKEDPIFLDTYSPYVLNKNALKGVVPQGEFDQTVAEIFAAQDGMEFRYLTPEEQSVFYREAVEFRRNRMDSSDGWRVADTDAMEKKSRYFKSRELFIPKDRVDLYERIEPYLLDDAMELAHGYTRATNADKFMNEIFPNDPAAVKFITEQKDYYDNLIKDNPSKEKSLMKERDTAIKMFEGVVNRLRGVNPYISGSPEWLWRFSRTARGVNNIRYLGGVTLSSAGDVVKLPLEYGFRNTLKMVSSFAISPVKSKLKSNELRQLLGIYEVVNNSRTSLLSDIDSTAFAGTRFEKAVSSQEKSLGILTGLSYWNQGAKTASAIVEQDLLISTALEHAAGKPLTRRQSFTIAEMGLNLDDLSLIAKHFNDKGETVSFTKYLNLGEMKDQDFAERVVNGLHHKVDMTINTPDPATMPIIKDHPLGQQVFHLMSFELATTTQTLIRGLQYRDSQVAIGVLGMVAMGAAIGVIKRTLRGQPTHLDDPSYLFADGFDRSGIGGIFTRANSIVDGLVPGLGVNRLISDKPLSRYQFKDPTTMAFGPLADLGNDLQSTLSIALSPITGADVYKSQVSDMFGLAPWGRMQGVQQILGVLEEQTNKALGAKQ